MSNKWKAFKKSGKYFCAGYIDAPADAESMVEFDGPQPDVIAEIYANRVAPLTAAELRAELVSKGKL